MLGDGQVRVATRPERGLSAALSLLAGSPVHQRSRQCDIVRRDRLRAHIERTDDLITADRVVRVHHVAQVPKPDRDACGRA